VDIVIAGRVRFLLARDSDLLSQTLGVVLAKNKPKPSPPCPARLYVSSLSVNRLPGHPAHRPLADFGKAGVFIYALVTAPIE
jgi:hypothetical protein